MSAVDLAELAALPAVVADLQARICDLEKRLIVVEHRGLSVREAAERRGCCEKTIRRQIEDGEIEHRWTGGRVAVFLD
jgi:excisionase family DNA binding protein